MAFFKPVQFINSLHALNPIHYSTIRKHMCASHLASNSPLCLPPFPDRRLAEPISLPSLRNCIHFLNLTNGLEALPMLRAAGIDPGFVRLQSTLCEQGQLEKVISDLEAALLLHLALGHCCLVYDFGSRNKKRAAPRALWYGLEFVRYALSCAWDVPLPSATHRAFLRGHDAHAAFDGHIREFSTSTKRKLKYYAQYLPPEGLKAVQIYGVYKATEHDVDFPFYLDIAHKHLLPNENFNNPQIRHTYAGTDRELIQNGSMLDTSSTMLPASGDGELPGVNARVYGAERVSSLLDGDIHTAVYELFGMHLFLGGLSHAEHSRWKAQS